MHIATSVLNRISNALEENGPLGLSNNQPAPVKLQEPLIAPDPMVLGSEINNQLAQPVAPVAVAPENQVDANNGMLNASVMGGSPFDGALIGATGQ
jgi:hypothetical protein